eukprot:s560_g16.t1
MGWQMPYAGRGSTCLDGSMLEERFGDPTALPFFECRHPIFPNVFESMENNSDPDFISDDDSGSGDSHTFYDFDLPGGVLRRLDRGVVQQPLIPAEEFEGGEEERLEDDVAIHSDDSVIRSLQNASASNDSGRNVRRRLFQE